MHQLLVFLLLAALSDPPVSGQDAVLRV